MMQTAAAQGLSARVNLGVQLVALLLAVALRAARPGLVTEFLVATVIAPLLALLPAALAVAALRLERLTARLAVPFVLCALSLVAFGALAPDVADGARWVPIFDLLGVRARHPIRMDIVGRVLGAGYLLALGWTAVRFRIEARAAAGR
ncbi:hypothetical protein SAMN05443637_10112 [Pseudonocardia thermophila]|uniref:Uncharacterized protein n=1 Tax=Pseudonocardia thermophila TaxID=1848 RepID=A0A1M6N434_PSETH|nr:hypothetical protein [Pseudonocardia thermophila]SHJ90448.1 hypothetical protein SAMN05443637_10112 [Pseudonocardia thermophila]